MSEDEKLRLTDIITQEEYGKLVGYINAHSAGNLHNNILDWLGTQPPVLERMNKHNILLTYFAYLLEAFLTSK